MDHSLISKLERYVRLSTDDRAALRNATKRRVRQVEARQDIIREGQAPDAVNIVLSGWACRYKQLEDGRRQIMAFFVPGDMCDLNVFVLREMDHSVGAITAVTLAELPRELVDEITVNHPRVTEAMWWDTLVSTSIQREWIVNLGQRDAFERVGHLLCELYLRLDGVGLTMGNSCELPLVQTDLADATGLSAVHVNRTLKELRAAGLIVLKGRMLHIPDLAALKAATMFNPNYLHLDHEGRMLDASE